MNGDSAARNGKKPTRTILVPPEQRPDLHYKDIKMKCEFWLQETECDVVPTMIHGKLTKLDLFGSGTQVNAATRVINKWLQVANTKAPASSAWAKLEAFDHNKWWYKNYDENEMERKSMFLGSLPEGHFDMFPITAIVPWPVKLVSDGVSVTPRDAFGNKLEYLNSIRMEDEVFIRLLPHRNPQWQVEIRGIDALNVDAAEAHYKNLAQKVLTKQTLGTASVNVIVDEFEGSQVRLSFADDWWPHGKGRLVPRLLPTSVMDAGNFRYETMNPDTLSSIEKALRKSLEALRFEQGAYVFAIRLGRLVLDGREMKAIEEKLFKQEVDETFDFKSFKKSIDGIMTCSVQRWLVKHDIGDEVLARLMHGSHLLEPTKSGGYFGVVPSSLTKTRPTFRGTWALRDPNSVRAAATTNRTPGRPTPQATGNDAAQPPSISLIVVQVEWTEDEEGEYEKMSPRFYRLKQGKTGPITHMDIKLLELGDSRGWNFSLESMSVVSKSTVSPTVVAFANSVTMTRGYNIGSNKLFAQWPRTPSVNIYNGRMEQVYTFGLVDTGYRVEAAKMWYPGVSMPCWGLAVHHREWELHLGELERLPPGRGAEWDDVVKTFFPDNGCSLTSAPKDKHGELLDLSELGISDEHGVRLLVTKLMELSNLVNGAAPTTQSLGKGLVIRDILS